MDPFIIAAICSCVVIIILSLSFLRVTNSKPQAGGKPRAVVTQEGGPGRVQAVRNQRARMRANAARHQAVLEEEPAEVEHAEDDNQNEAKAEISDKMGAKKRAKLEAKLERQKAREAEEQMREIRKKKDEQREEERRKFEEKEEEETRKREEAEKKAEEERIKKEQAEYEKMKACFVVESEGYEEEEQDGQNLLQEFIEYVKTQKVVMLEDLAAHFKLKTLAVIDRITELQNSGELTGVIDDRGKFICISMKELEDVAKFIKQRGRVSVTDLVESSNELINLNPVAVL